MQCWTRLRWLIRPRIAETGVKVRTPTTARAHAGTRQVAYHLWVSTAGIGMKGTCTTSFTTVVHTTRLRTGAKNEIVLNANDTKRGTMIIMALTMTNPTGIILWLEDAMKRGSSLSLVT
jgi:hypothetical protein